MQKSPALYNDEYFYFKKIQGVDEKVYLIF